MAEVQRDGESYSVRLAADELSIVLACLREAWEALDDHEFRVRSGFPIEAAVQLRETLREQLRALPDSRDAQL